MKVRNKNIEVMNEVRKTHEESLGAYSYVSPRAKVVQFQPEGIICGSVIGIGHDDFIMGQSFDLE